MGERRKSSGYGLSRFDVVSHLLDKLQLLGFDSIVISWSNVP